MTNPYSSPTAEVIETNSGSIDGLPRVSTWLVFLFTICTFGLYMIYWLYNRLAKLNPLIENKIPLIFLHIYVCITLLSWGVQASMFTSLGESALIMSTFEIVNAIGSIVSMVCLYMVIYKMRNRLCDELLNTQRWGGVKTFFFSVFYLNYKINEAHDQRS
jgi:hypothetical protein